MTASGAIAALIVAIPAGTHTPFYPSSEEEREIAVPAFRLDATPVTQGELLAFVQTHSEWRRDRVPRLLADARYLEGWEGPEDLGSIAPGAPATQVSWHAARAYCASMGGDLPTVTQWEYAADATATGPHGARKDPATLTAMLDWYGQGGATRPGPVGQSPPNHYGLFDMFGLVWEWTLDFNSLLVADDAREAGDEEQLRFCGAGAISSADAEDYASFMRFAFRSSLVAASTTGHLGFRCAYPSSSF